MFLFNKFFVLPCYTRKCLKTIKLSEIDVKQQVPIKSKSLLLIHQQKSVTPHIRVKNLCSPEPLRETTRVDMCCSRASLQSRSQRLRKDVATSFIKKNRDFLRTHDFFNQL